MRASNLLVPKFIIKSEVINPMMLVKSKIVFILVMFFFGFVNILSGSVQAQTSCEVCVDLYCDNSTNNCHKMFTLIAVDDQVKPISADNRACSNLVPGKHFVAIIFSDAPGPDQIKVSNKIDFEIKSGETLMFNTVCKQSEGSIQCVLTPKTE